MRLTVFDGEPQLARAALVAQNWADTFPAASRVHGADPTQQIAAILIGTAADRMGPALSEEGASIIQRRVSECIRLGSPIAIHVMWGGLKHYVDLDQQDIDAAELFALIQFYRLHRSIERIYAPGASVCFYLEDFGVTYEDAGGRDQATHEKIRTATERYCARFEELVAAVGQPFAICKRFADVCPHEQWPSMTLQADKNRAVMKSVYALCERGDEASMNEAREATKRIGWQGDLPAVMRKHYLGRLRSLYPLEHVEESVDRLLRYFAMVCLYQQTGVYQPATPSTKFAMYLPSPGIPQERLQSRVHLRTLSSNYSSQTMPPWTSLGCFEIARGGTPVMKIRSRKLVRQKGIAMHPIELRVEGVGGSAIVRSHMLQG